MAAMAWGTLPFGRQEKYRLPGIVESRVACRPLRMGDLWNIMLIVSDPQRLPRNIAFNGRPGIMESDVLRWNEWLLHDRFIKQ